MRFKDFLNLNEDGPVDLGGSLKQKCKHCGKQKGDHKGGTLACPIGRKSAKWGYEYSKNSTFAPDETRLVSKPGELADLKDKCINCGRTKGSHQAITGNCPEIRRGYSGYNRNSKYADGKSKPYNPDD